MSAPVRHRPGRGIGRGRCCYPGSDRGRLLCPRRLSGVELPVALFDAASALVPGNGGADVVWASPLHAAVICCCVLPVASTRTLSLRVGGVRLPPAGFAVVVRRRPRDRAGAAASVAAVGIFAEAVFLRHPRFCRPSVAVAKTPRDDPRSLRFSNGF
jgi:hypothetical protein